MRWLTLACLLTGCVPVPVHGPQTILHHSLVNYAPQLLDPSNCGTPDDYKLCITAPGPRPFIPGEPLPDLTQPMPPWEEEPSVPVPSPPPPPNGA